MAATLYELTLADDPRAWRDCGFEVRGDACLVGETRIRFIPRAKERGLVGWSLQGISSSDLDGLPTVLSTGRPRREETPAHPNGVTWLDHIVAVSSDLDRTVAALLAAGLDFRHVREEPTPAGAPRQAFFRLGQVILEIVQEPREATELAGGDRPAFFWGLAFTAPDLEATATFLGDRVGEVRPAVQPGRRIATLRREAGLSLPVALITPPASPAAGG
ncbi:MAG TPA: hypothetical protein VFM51_08980 [Solirubrobacterales bacterium]|nr:hypothetical protein [Solirubrobacterales bacterium]